MSFDLNQGATGVGFSFGAVGTQPGAHVAGVVLNMENDVPITNFETGKPEFWDNGDKKTQIRLTLQTDLRDPTEPADDGRRAVYLSGRPRPNDNGSKSKLCAVIEAVRSVTGGTEINPGDKITLQWVSGMGFSGDPRSYQAWYERGALDLGAQQPPVAPPAAAPAAPVAPPLNQGPPPAWATGQPVPPPAAAAPPVAPPQAQLPISPSGPNFPPVVAAAAPGQTGPTFQAGTPAPAPAAPGPPPLTQQVVTGMQAAGIDPGVVYGPGWEQRVTA